MRKKTTPTKTVKRRPQVIIDNRSLLFLEDALKLTVTCRQDQRLANESAMLTLEIGRCGPLPTLGTNCLQFGSIEVSPFSRQACTRKFLRGLLSTQKEAEAFVKTLNPDDKPDVERVCNTQTGGRDQWRKE